MDNRFQVAKFVDRNPSVHFENSVVEPQIIAWMASTTEDVEAVALYVAMDSFSVYCPCSSNRTLPFTLRIEISFNNFVFK